MHRQGKDLESLGDFGIFPARSKAYTSSHEQEGENNGKYVSKILFPVVLHQQKQIHC